MRTVAAKAKPSITGFRKQGSATATPAFPKAPAALLNPPAKSSLNLIESIQSGLRFAEVEKLQGRLNVSLDELGPLLGIARATLHRRKKSGRLDPQESDRVVRYKRLLDRATAVLETPANARAWLFARQRGLNGERPVDFARTEVGAREVEDLLERIDHSVYS